MQMKVLLWHSGPLVATEVDRAPTRRGPRTSALDACLCRLSPARPAAATRSAPLLEARSPSPAAPAPSGS